MQKSLIVFVVLLVLGVGGYFGYQQYQIIQHKRLVAAQQVAETARVRAKQAAADNTRKEVEAALKPMKVTSIIPGKPGLAIIDKKEYAEGDQLALPKDKKLRITAVRDDGILLAYNGLAFRLAPPAAPDLDAIRKPR